MPAHLETRPRKVSPKDRELEDLLSGVSSCQQSAPVSV